MAPFFFSLLPLKWTWAFLFSLVFLLLCYRPTHPQGQSNTKHTNTPTRTNKQIAYGSAAPAEIPFVGQRKWIGGAVVEISVYGPTGSVDQYLWKRSMLVEEIIVFFSPIAYAFFLYAPFILLFPSNFFSQQNHKITLAPTSTIEFEKSIEEKKKKKRKKNKE